MLRWYLHSLPHRRIDSVSASRIDDQSTAQECPSRNPHSGFERYTRGRCLSHWDSHRVHVHVLLGGVVSTKAIKLYLFMTKGTHVISSKTSELLAVQASRG